MEVHYRDMAGQGRLGWIGTVIDINYILYIPDTVDTDVDDEENLKCQDRYNLLIELTSMIDIYDR